MNKFVLGCDGLIYPWLKLQWYYECEQGKDRETKLPQFMFFLNRTDHQEIIPPSVIRGTVMMYHKCNWEMVPGSGVGVEAAGRYETAQQNADSSSDDEQRQSAREFCELTDNEIKHNYKNNFYLKNVYEIERV